MSTERFINDVDIQVVWHILKSKKGIKESIIIGLSLLGKGVKFLKREDTWELICL